MLSIVVLAACGDSSQPLAAPPEARASATTETTSQVVTIASSEFVPCANGGVGEIVNVAGSLHVVDHATETGNGQFHLSHHENPQGLTGTGQVTGDVYHNVGSAHFHINLNPAETATQLLTFKLVGPGPDNNLYLRGIAHFTVNANGVVTVDRSEFTVECS
jgi:hypothetical protein